MAPTDDALRPWQTGDLVRHTKLADRGVGVVVGVQGDKVEINFEHHGAARFNVFAARLTLVLVSPNEIEAESPLLDPKQWMRYAVPPKERTVAATCHHCKEPLKRARTSAAGRGKACPGCSQRNGAEHVFYESPAAFGTSTKRVTKNNPEGVQSHCLACRQEGLPGAFRAWLCSEK